MFARFIQLNQFFTVPLNLCPIATMTYFHRSIHATLNRTQLPVFFQSLYGEPGECSNPPLLLLYYMDR